MTNKMNTIKRYFGLIPGLVLYAAAMMTLVSCMAEDAFSEMDGFMSEVEFSGTVYDYDTAEGVGPADAPFSYGIAVGNFARSPVDLSNIVDIDIGGELIACALLAAALYNIGKIFGVFDKIGVVKTTASLGGSYGRAVPYVVGGGLLGYVKIDNGIGCGGLEEAAEIGCDAFISGEVSERTFHQAKELGVTYFACGHHATERFGVRALGELIASRADIEVKFVDIDNPI